MLYLDRKERLPGEPTFDIIPQIKEKGQRICVTGCHAHARVGMRSTSRGNSPVPADHRKKCRRINEPGHAHALTCPCFKRRPFLSKDRSRGWLLEAIELAREKHRLHVWAYAIMPEHFHLIIWPTIADYSISGVLTTIKQSVSKRALVYLREHAPAFLRQMEDRDPNGVIRHRFWLRGGGYDRNLTEPKTVWAEIDYLHANPVKRGLCARSIDWPWSSAIEYEQPGSGLLRIDRESLPRTPEG